MTKIAITGAAGRMGGQIARRTMAHLMLAPYNPACCNVGQRRATSTYDATVTREILGRGKQVLEWIKRQF